MDTSSACRCAPGYAAVLVVCLLLGGCATLPRTPVPADQIAWAVVPGMPDVRAWAGRPNRDMEEDFEQSIRDERPEQFPVAADGRIHYPHLALSGGGANGAFGAGFLNGWTATGSRPTFKIVTGVSTGALMAPYAFLGPDHDDALRRFYTTTSDADVFAAGNPLMALLRRDALANTAPLEALIARAIDAPLLARIAAEHRAGRRLYMGTADLDSRQFVVWNMGLIATRGSPEALALFRRVMLASASIPIAFPPVLIEVDVLGKRYDEMHVDGFVAANIFLHAGIIDPQRLYNRLSRAPATYDAFMIHNGQLAAASDPAERSLRGIAFRSIDVAGRAGMIGDLFREYAYARRDGARFAWVTIDSRLALADAASFDPARMTVLYQVGYDRAREGPVWLSRPPGMSPADEP
ncbi:patatin-like phospholipase family protein [uncultured Stenotrophomonas sp.]|uniref:patatin-like phospholipase family protein n=1 Tax=uncultured Stenotrophomonas sp. TaxID=165438 RepID=UPI0028D74B51|nr:patatin-like phospholipase family protein [uncultured Stenotrophomonas sp.]